MVRILAIADEVEESLGQETLRALAPDVVVACGDLPFDYLEYVVTMASVPLLYVPGNHDPVVRHPDEPATAPVLIGQGLFASGVRRGDQPQGPRSSAPGGCTCIDGRIVNAAGLRVAGLGGSHRYSEGPNQYTQAQMRRRALGLELRARLGRHRGVDVLVTHAPPLGTGDEDDACHQGFRAFHRVVERLGPEVLLHGHIHPYGQARPDRSIGRTRVVNVIPHRLLEVRGIAPNRDGGRASG